MEEKAKIEFRRRKLEQSFLQEKPITLAAISQSKPLVKTADIQDRGTQTDGVKRYTLGFHSSLERHFTASDLKVFFELSNFLQFQAKTLDGRDRSHKLSEESEQFCIGYL